MWAQSPAEMGKIVAAGRRHRGLTQSQLARAVGVAQNWISEIERGKDTAQIGKVLQLLSFLGVRLQVGEAPWMPDPQRPPAARSRRSKKTSLAEKISLADIIAAHSQTVPKRGKAKR